jgi:membrane-bound inhibitor of C-type lysozyme
MSTMPPTLNQAVLRLALVVGASTLLLGTAACQRQPAPAADAGGTAPAVAPPAASSPAAPAPATGDARDEPPAGALRAYVWYCADGQKLVMRNLFREKAIAIDFHDGTRRLDQTMSASGARYADAVAAFWIKGSAATLERQGAPLVKCEERRAESLVEDARARGVEFRAVGNEPGWVLEVGPAGRISWTTNFGAERFDFDRSQSTAAEGAQRYTAQQGMNAIGVTVRAERCVDDGEVEFGHSASVEFAGQTYRGCGLELKRN